MQLSLSHRARILRILQYKFGNFDPDPWESEEDAETAISLFHHYQEYNTDISQTKREYQHCLFATRTNDRAAAALYLEFGPCSFYRIFRKKCTQVSLAKETFDETGIKIDFRYPFDLANHVKDTLSSIQVELERCEVQNCGQPLTKFQKWKILEKIYPRLFFFDRHYLSVPSEISYFVRSASGTLLHHLLATPKDKRGSIKIPELQLDYSFLEAPQSIEFPYSVFNIQACARQSNTASLVQYNQNRTFLTVQEKIAENDFQPDVLYPSATIRKVLGSHVIENAIKKNILIRPKRGYYQFAPELFEQPPPEEEELTF